MTGALPSPAHHRPRLIAAGESLPQSCFPLVAAPGTVVWSQGRMASVIFVPHRDPCLECRAYALQLAGAVGGLEEWGSRLLLLAPSAAEAAFATAGAGSGILLLDDADGAGRTALGLAEDQAAVVQADRWGAVYEAAAVGRPAVHAADLPTPEELVAMAKFIDIQCPECGVPSKEWLQASPFPLG
jgi:hypothetical protein